MMIGLQLSLSICVVVFSWCVLYWWPRRRVWAMAKKVPGPPSHPLIGNALMFRVNLTEIIPIVMSLFDEYGSVVRLWLGPRAAFIIKDPRDIQQVLGSPKIRNRDWNATKALSKFLGDNLLTLRGDQWKIHRTLITPMFHFKILETYLDVFGRKSKILIDKLQELEGKSFNVYDILALCTLETICETAIGTAVNSLAVGKSREADNLHEGQQHTMRRILRPWLLIDFIYAFTSDGRGAKELTMKGHEFSEHVIGQKLAEYRRGIRSPSLTTASNKKVSSFLDILIEASEAEASILSPEEMRDEVTTMAAVGTETSATAMSFFLILIALHSEVQSSIHQELDEVFGTDSRLATSEDLHKLCVVERCIKETLRLFPVVPFLPREIDEDLKLPSGYVLPANCSVACISILTHRDANNFPDPDKFWPDRWLPENAEKVHPYAYIPYGAGLRNCVGQKYAQLQMKSVLSQILRSYRVTTPLTMPDLEKLELGITIRMDTEVKNRYHVQLHKRSNKAGENSKSTRDHRTPNIAVPVRSTNGNHTRYQMG